MTKSVLRYAGLAAPPLAWALSTQLGQITPYADCRQGTSLTLMLCAVLLAVSVAGMGLSRIVSTNIARPERFVADVGFLLALTSVFALLLQGAASVLLDACQR